MVYFLYVYKVVYYVFKELIAKLYSRFNICNKCVFPFHSDNIMIYHFPRVFLSLMVSSGIEAMKYCFSRPMRWRWSYTHKVMMAIINMATDWNCVEYFTDINFWKTNRGISLGTRLICFLNGMCGCCVKYNSRIHIIWGYLCGLFMLNSEETIVLSRFTYSMLFLLSVFWCCSWGGQK